MDRLRRTGMSIAEMREYTARKRVQDTIDEWTQALSLLDGKIDFYGEWLSTGKRPPLDTLAPATARRTAR